MGVQVGERPKPSGVESSRWFRPPRLRTVEREPGERRATWLELFFDLGGEEPAARRSRHLCEGDAIRKRVGSPALAWTSGRVNPDASRSRS